ncbi:MAG: cytochrome c family protein [Desulfobulbaceae bacterium]|nr:cytochrome c family protein [Desulfobulbaceae bacterium]
MKRGLLCAVMLCCLVSAGCGRDDNNQKSSAVVPEQKREMPQENEQFFTEQTMATIDKVAQPVAGKASTTADEVKEKAADVAAVVKGKTVVAKEKTAKLATEVREKSAPAVEKAEHAATVVGKAVRETAGKVAQIVNPPETVVIDNKNGKVTLPHAKHGNAFGCVPCHGDAPPNPFKMGKDTAHKVCKGCHQEKGKGPSQCSGCHVKKKSSTVEGC